VFTDRWLHRWAWGLPAGDRPADGLSELRTECLIAASLEETFAFFADAANLERLTPPWLRFTVRTPLPIVMRTGVVVDYRIVFRGLPIAWRSRIDAWEPGRRFVDRQVFGPYRWWRHEHLFERGSSGTRVIDIVEFQPRLRRLTGGQVRRDVERIFAFRQQALSRRFGTPTS
jgi:ligand-binding SRPBCC domain-containing protein